MNQQGAVSWLDSLKLFRHRRVVTMFFLGFSAGIPLLLIFSSLSLWLREAGLDRSTVTFFSWAALGYSFKFVWAPLIDRLPVPWLTGWLGRRRAWMLVAQILIALAILLMASIDPQAGDASLKLMALAAVMLGFSAATQDIVIDAYRIESAKVELQAMMSATYIVGYRLAMMLTGAGSLYLAQGLGSTKENYVYEAWQGTYSFMALAMLVGVITTLVISEPLVDRKKEAHESTQNHLRLLLLFVIAIVGFIGFYSLSSDLVMQGKQWLTSFLGNKVIASTLLESIRLVGATASAGLLAVLMVMLKLTSYQVIEATYLLPVREFFERQGWSLAWLLLALIGLYRISDIVLGVISNVFYQDLGFSKAEIGSAVSVFGVLMTIVGGLLGGLLAVRVGVLRILLLGAVLAAVTNLLFMLLATIGKDMVWFYLVIAIDNLAAGLASAAFVAFLSSLTNISFTAMQYAIFSSLMTLIPKSLGGYSGSIVDTMGYPGFFLFTAILGIPVIVLILLTSRRFEIQVPKPGT